MKKISTLFLALLWANTAFADSAAISRLMGLGMADQLASQVDREYASSVKQSELPATDNTYDLGSASKQFRTLYAGTSILDAGDLNISTAAKGVVVGETARAANVTTATTLAVPLYCSAAASGTDLAAFVGSGASTSGPVVDFFKTRATSGAATTIVTSGDTLGTVKFFGANGTTYDPAAAIVVTSDATPGATTDMPGAIDFQTTPDGSATLASALKLNNAKKATFGGNIALSGTSAKIIAGPTSLLVRDNADANSNLVLTDAGGLTIRAGLALTTGNVSFQGNQVGLVENIGTLSGAGSTQTDAAAVVTTVARVTGANGTVGVKLPPLANVGAGRQITIINSDVTNLLKVYSNAVGETITGQGGTTAISLAAKLMLRCWSYDASNWYCEKGTLPY